MILFFSKQIVLKAQKRGKDMAKRFFKDLIELMKTDRNYRGQMIMSIISLIVSVVALIVVINKVPL